MVGITSSGKQVKSANTLAIRTPKLGAPTVASADPTGPTTALVRLTPPTTGQPPSLYIVRVCLKAVPTSCATRNSSSILCPLAGLAAGSDNVVSATAVIAGRLVPASNSLPLRMPTRGAPTLLSAEATTSTTGAATASVPSGATFARVRGGCRGCGHGEAGGGAAKHQRGACSAGCRTRHTASHRPNLAPAPSAVRLHRTPSERRRSCHLLCVQPAQWQLHWPAGCYPVSALGWHGALECSWMGGPHPAGGRGEHAQQACTQRGPTIAPAPAACCRAPAQPRWPAAELRPAPTCAPPHHVPHPRKIRYSVSVVGYRNGVASPPSNTMLFVTPAANAPLNKGVATSPTTVVVRLTPPSLPPLDGGAWCGPQGNQGGGACACSHTAKQRLLPPRAQSNGSHMRGCAAAPAG